MITHYNRRQHGLSLIELLVALGLGAFLMLGVVNVFISTKESSSIEAALARVQENGRLAIQLISQDVRKAHYSGCNSVGGIVELIATNVTWEGLRGYERDASSGNWSPDPNNPTLTAIKTTARKGSDVLNVQLADSLGKNLLAADVTSTTSEAKLTDNPDCSIEKDDLIIVSSCLSSHLFRVTNTINCANPADDVTLKFSTAGNLALPIEPGYRYGDISEVLEYQSVSWFVADTGRDLFGEDVYALYRAVNGTAEEMVEGVEYMRVEFGQKVAGQMRYVTASDANLDWEQVSTVRFALLLQGFEQIRNDEDVEPYNLLSTVVSASGNGSHSGGRVLRRTFSTTATLRNSPYDT